MLDSKAAQVIESRFVPAQDGLSLHVRCYLTAGRSAALPVLCLPGLSRTEADFEPLARFLAFDDANPRDVYALDSRGRGQSAYDPDWRNYNLGVELGDVGAALAALGIGRALLVGTSRGGMLTMLLAATRPGLVAGAVLNDIGPVIEPAGLTRIRSYVGKLPQPLDFADGASILRRTFGTQFPRLTDRDWLAWARRSWRVDEGRLVATYDVMLARTLEQMDEDQPIADLWEPFRALATVPVLLVRGALTDLLSVETVAAMRTCKPDLETIEVPDQGHAPLLSEADVMSRIADFLSRSDRAAAA